MVEGPYSVIFKGLAQGRKPEEVKRNLGAIYKKKPQMVEAFFKGKPVVIKKGVDQATALKYKKMFEQAGAACNITSGQKMAPARPPGKRPAPPPAPGKKKATPKAAMPMMVCPKCGHEQAESPDCVNCGIIIARYMQKRLPPKEDASPAGPQDETGRTLHPAQAKAGMIYGEDVIESVNFFTSLPGVFIYPFVGKGIWILFTGIITLTILTLMDFIILVGTGIKFFFWAYFTAYAIKIVNSSAEAEKEPPHWPELTNFISDIGGPIFRMLGVTILCYVPAVVYASFALYSMMDSGGYADLFDFSKSPSLEILIFGGLFIAGSAYYPMAILATSMSGRLISANPLTIIPSILKTFVDYVICLVVYLVIVFVRGFAEQVMVLPIPLLGVAIYNALALYFIMVEMRLLGLLYNANAERLNWFGEY